MPRTFHGASADDSKVVVEYTGSYYEPIARFLHNEGIYVSVVNAILIHNSSGNSVRRAKTDKKDSVRSAQYALDRLLKFHLRKHAVL